MMAVTTAFPACSPDWKQNDASPATSAADRERPPTGLTAAAGPSAHDHPGARESGPGADASQQTRQHPLGRIELSDDTLTDRVDGEEPTRGPAHHRQRLAADGLNAVPRVEDDHRRLVSNNPAPLGEDHGIGRAHVDGEIPRCRGTRPEQAGPSPRPLPAQQRQGPSPSPARRPCGSAAGALVH